MNAHLENPSCFSAESIERIFMLLEIIRLKDQSEEADALRREFLRLYRTLRRYEDAEALRKGTRKPVEERISVFGLLHEILQEAQHEAILRGFTLRVDVDETLYLNSDREFLRQIIWNLLQNAIAAGNGVEIILQARALDQKCCFSVLDNGKGFEDCDPQTLFRQAPEFSGFGIIRTLLSFYDSELTFDRQNGYTAVSFVLPRITEPSRLHAPDGKLGYSHGLSDAEIEFSILD